MTLASEIIRELKRKNSRLTGAVAALAAALIGVAIYECFYRVHRA